MDTFTLLDDGRATEVPALAGPSGVRLPADAVRDAFGWVLKPQGLCRGDTCLPVRDVAGLVDPDGIDLAALAALLERPLALDVGERIAWLGTSAAERGARLGSLKAPDFALPDLAGRTHRLVDQHGRKVLLLAWASWCGCRHDLPIWESLHAELADGGFTLLSVALDQGPDDARPWIEAAAPTHPALLDTEHRVADLYRFINVPTAVWIDEHGRIVRPNDAVFATDAYVGLHGRPARPHLDAVRAWVREGRRPFADDAAVRAHQVLPTPAEQLARAEFALAWFLHRAGRRAAAERHFVRASELAPHDFTIRRGSMPIRGLDPMGADFAPLFQEWMDAGTPYYAPMPPLRDD